MKFALLFLCGLALAFPALAQEHHAGAGQARPGNWMRGEALAHLWCTGCHAVKGAPVAADTGPTFMSIARDPNMGPDFLRGFLSKPHAPMPPLELTGGEIEDFVAYFRHLGTEVR